MKRSVRIRFLLSLLLAATATVGIAPSEAAPPKNAAGADDLRVMYAGSLDVAEGKRVAKQSCAHCHGMDGIATTIKGIPNLAGQRAPYLLMEMQAYKAGGRSDKSMDGAVKFLSDDALFAAAAYYASLDPAPPSSAKVAAKADALSAGKAAAAGCAGCHGDNGVSKTSGVPSLIGQDPAYLVAAMTAYKAGQRKDEMMQTLVGALSDKEMKNIALFYALQKTAAAQTQVSGDKVAGKAAAAACAGCHGEQGVSGSPATPSLAGQESQYFIAALQAYKKGSRSDDTMKGVAASLDNSAMTNLAAYYAALPPQAPKVTKPLSTLEWTQRCDRCHGIDGNSIDPRAPALAAQRADYLEKVLLLYKSGARKSPQMAAMTGMLSEDDAAGLAAYYSRQKQRAVIFVPLPAK